MTIIYGEFSTTASFAAAPWSYNLHEILTGQSVTEISGDLKDDSNVSTTYTLDTIAVFDSAASSAGYATADNDWPKEVYWVNWRRSGVAAEIQFGNLPVGDSYNLKLAGQTTNAPSANRKTTFTVEGVSLDYTPTTDAANVPNPVEFTGIVPVGGTIDVSIEKESLSVQGVISGYVLEITAASGPTITDIDTNNDVFPGQSADITGTDFGAVQGDVSLGGVAQTVTAWADTEITITVVQSGLKYGDHDLIVTDDSAASSAALTTTLSPSSTNQFVNVSIPVSDNTSLFFGASPAVATGDQLEAPLLTTQGKALTINADGTFVITAASGLQTFSIRVWDATDETWSTSAIATINGEVTIFTGGSMARPMVNG